MVQYGIPGGGELGDPYHWPFSPPVFLVQHLFPNLSSTETSLSQAGSKREGKMPLGRFGLLRHGRPGQFMASLLGEKRGDSTFPQNFLFFQDNGRGWDILPE